MSINYFPPKPQRLHSPLLDGKKKDLHIDDTLDSTLFIKKRLTNPKPLEENNTIDQKSIDTLETSFKIVAIFILAMGGILSILELISIIKILSSGSFDFGNSILVFLFSFFSTILATVICLGFSHLVKMTRYIYTNLETQKEKSPNS